MRFILLSLVTVVALAVSSGSASAQFRTRGGFSNPQMMSVRPNSGMSPFMHSPFVRPNFNTASFAHPHQNMHFGSAVLFPRTPFATSNFRTAGLFAPTSPFGRTFATTPFSPATTGVFLSPSVQSSFVAPQVTANSRFMFWGNGGSLMSPWWW